jgi:hypothetical protein
MNTPHPRDMVARSNVLAIPLKRFFRHEKDGEISYSLDASEAGIRPGSPYPGTIIVEPAGREFLFTRFDAEHTAHYQTLTGLTLKLWND